MRFEWDATGRAHSRINSVLDSIVSRTVVTICESANPRLEDLLSIK